MNDERRRNWRPATAGLAEYVSVRMEFLLHVFIQILMNSITHILQYYSIPVLQSVCRIMRQTDGTSNGGFVSYQQYFRSIAAGTFSFHYLINDSFFSCT